MKLGNVERWTEGKAPFPALISAWLVIHADQFYGMMKLLSCHKAYAMLFSAEDIDAWSRLYSHFFGELPTPEALGAAVDSPMLEEWPMLKTGLENLSSWDDLNHPLLVGWIRVHFLDNFHVVEDESSEEERLRGLSPLLQYPALAFAFKILLPCITYYRVTPAVLMKKARNGDHDAFCNLLRLDKNFLSLPEMASIWEPINRDTESAAFKSAIRAMSNSPHKALKPSRVKTVIAAAIEGLFKIMEQDITRPQIRDLFDRYAQDTEGSMVDQDLPDSENGFDEAVRREIRAFKIAAQDIV